MVAISAAGVSTPNRRRCWGRCSLSSLRSTATSRRLQTRAATGRIDEVSKAYRVTGIGTVPGLDCVMTVVKEDGRSRRRPVSSEPPKNPAVSQAGAPSPHAPSGAAASARVSGTKGRSGMALGVAVIALVVAVVAAATAVVALQRASETQRGGSTAAPVDDTPAGSDQE